VLGAVLGLVLGAAGVVALLLGLTTPQGHALTVGMAGAGLVVLAVVALLGSWTAAVPITAGVVTAIPGLFGLVAPDQWSRLVGKVPHIGYALLKVPGDTLVAALGSSAVAVVGVLLIASGLTTIIVRRRAEAR